MPENNVLLRAYLLIFGEEPQGFSSGQVAKRVWENIEYLDAELEIGCLVEILRLHNAEAIQLTSAEKMLLESDLAWLK
ncbi:MAG: hypothetical protein HZA25_02570 [Candidatus Niyogibacteria bacterium]|nr:hypothetical protein [Candidatus Niyogibacteria bacterium]